ncbi:MAG: hypothetical protein R2712_04650 [Vicinamibacterales bacterium]
MHTRLSAFLIAAILGTGAACSSSSDSHPHLHRRRWTDDHQAFEDVVGIGDAFYAFSVETYGIVTLTLEDRSAARPCPPR